MQKTIIAGAAVASALAIGITGYGFGARTWPIPFVAREKLALGVFLFVSPWLFGFPSALERTTSWMAGATIVIVAVSSIANLLESVSGPDWFTQEEWINLTIGLWLAVCPWVLGFHGDATARDVYFAVGLGIAVIAAVELWLLHRKLHA
jgi:hypothetical protein